MKKEFVFILSIVFLVLFIGIVASAIYINIDTDQYSNRVRINKNILEYDIKVTSNEDAPKCLTYSCFIYPKVEQTYSNTRLKAPEQIKADVCDNIKTAKCDGGCLEPLNQEKSKGHLELPVQTRKECNK